MKNFNSALVMAPLAAILASLIWVMSRDSSANVPTPAAEQPPFLVVLGISQDGGCPQAGCTKPCCANRWDDPEKRLHVACLAIVDPSTNQRWLIDATPDFPAQLRMLDSVAPPKPGDTGAPGPAGGPPALDGIVLTHAHIGHYTGLMNLGREAIGAKNVPVYAMPRMREFLSHNGPWDQLVRLGNISVHPLEADVTLRLNDRITITPLPVPHRDEYSETVGFRIAGPNQSALYVPDIDKWDTWTRRLEDVLAEVDVAFIDGTFYADGEIPGRSMAEIPHPFITETMQRLASLPAEQRNKVVFIHLNHTNPAMGDDSAERQAILRGGFHVARELDRHPF